MTAVAGNLAAMAGDILSDWTAAPNEFGQHFAAGTGTAYRSPSEATLDIFKALYTAVELIADHKLARPLGGSGKPARPQLAESWRSGTSLANVNANLAAARDLFERLRPGVADASLVSEMATRFAAAREAAAAIDSLEEAIADPARRPAVERLRREVTALKTIMAERLTAALGLPLGFNALDGD
jgi:predicted lipoprotein